MAERLTDRLVRSLQPPPTGNRITYDTLPGFGARITSASAISFILNYRRKSDGRERRATIGRFPAWSVAGARQRAAELRRAVDNGGDPVGELAAERGAPTVAELCARFEEEHLPKLRPSTQTMYRAILRNEIVPAFGGAKVAAVEYEDVDRLIGKIGRRAPYMANRVRACLSKMFALAVFWRLRADNPVRHVSRNQEQKRARYLSSEELARLIDVLSAYPNRQVIDVIRVLLLTGCRKAEALSATWDQFNLTEGIWTKPAATTKTKKDHAIPLGAAARALLAEIRERDGTARYVFPGPGPRGYRTSIKRDWLRICERAGITGLRVHDLRHSHASMLAGAGFSLPTIGALLGHTVPSTTARYAHLTHSVLREAAERVGAIVAGVGQPGAKITPIRRRR
jgi:integrase